MQELSTTHKTLLWILLPLAVAALVFSFFFKSSPTSQTPTSSLVEETVVAEEVFRIGVLAPLQGDSAIEGAMLAQGAKVAEAIINEDGGVQGKKLVVTVVDTRSNANITKDLSTELIERRKVDVVIGTISEESSVAAIDQLRETETPFIYVANGAVKTCSEKNVLTVEDNIWGLGLTPQMTAEPFVIFLAERFRQAESPFGVFYFSSDTEHNLRETSYFLETAESLGFPTRGEEIVDLRISNLFQRIRNIFDDKPELLFVSTDGSATKNFIEQAVKLGIKAEMSVAGIEAFREEHVRNFLNFAESTHSVARYSSDIDTPLNERFLSKWKSMFPESAAPTATAAAGGFGGIKIAAAALNNAKSRTLEDFKKAMRNLEVELPQGKVVVEENNHLLVQPLFATTVSEGKYKVAEYLGDVSHPALESCAIQQVIEESEG